MWSRYFALDKTCNNSKFQTTFVINYLAGKDKKINHQMQKKSGNMARFFEEFPNINEKENMPFFKTF